MKVARGWEERVGTVDGVGPMRTIDAAAAADPAAGGPGWSDGPSASAPSTGAVLVREAPEEGYGEERQPLPDLAELPDVERFRALEQVDPDAEPDLLEDLGGAIVTLAAHAHAVKQRILAYVAEFDRLGGWKPGGYRSCADWLHCRAGVALGAAQEWVRTAHGLKRLPLTSAAMSRGEISFSKARALTRAVEVLADPESEHAEAAVLEFAKASTAAELEKRVRSWKLHAGAPDEAELERRRHALRTLSIRPDGDGTYRIRGRVTAEVGALLMRAVEAGSDALFREGEDWAPEGGARGPTTREVTPSQRRADALGLIAELAMAVGFGGEEEAHEGVDDVSAESEDRPSAEEEADEGVGDVSAESEDRASAEEDAGAVDSSRRAQRSRGGLSQRDSRSGVVPLGSAESGTGARAGSASTGTASTPCSCNRPPLSGTRAQRYQVTVHVDLRTLAALGGEGSDGANHADTFCHLEDGTRVSAEAVRRLCCDGSFVRVIRGEDGEVLSLGRRTRTISPALRRALEIRDGGCRWPGCGLRFFDGHHVKHWLLGGKTELENLVSLCRHHHRAVHEDGFSVRRTANGRFQFFDRKGWPLPDRRPPPRLAFGAVERLVADNHRRGISPRWDTPSARYERGSHIPWELEARAREALDPVEPPEHRPTEPRGGNPVEPPEPDPAESPRRDPAESPGREPTELPGRDPTESPGREPTESPGRGDERGGASG